jgi:predicted permease
MRELSRAVRALLRQPAFTLSVVLTLGLGLGVATGFFGVISALLLRPLPGVDARGLVSLHVDRSGEDDAFSGFSRPTFLDLKERSRTLAGLEAFIGRGCALEDDAALVGGQLVSGGFFGLLGTRPRLGRLLGPEDDRPGADAVAVLSEPLWQRRFGGDPGVVGRTVRVNGRPFTVVGIAEEGFRGHFVGFPLDLYLPLAAAEDVAADVRLQDRADDSLELVARLLPATSRAAAQAEVSAIAAGLEREHPVLRGQGIEVRPYTGLDADLRGPVIGFMAVLAAVGTLVLLVATVNVAGLVLARGVARARDLAVRAALGASRADLVRPLLVETLLLFAAGGALGAALVRPSAALMQAFLPTFAIPLHLDVRLDLRVAAFAAAVTLVAGLVFGLGPAARAARVDVASTLQWGGRGLLGGRDTGRRVFVGAQASLSLVLLFAAALFLRELRAGRAFDPGFRTAEVGVVTVDLSLLGRRAAPPATFFEAWRERVLGRGGVTAVALVGQPPLGLGRASALVSVDGVEAPTTDGFRVGFSAVGPGYFDTLGIPLESGRDFDAGDASGRDAVAIVSRSTAARFFGTAEALGRTLRRGETVLRIVGVAGDVAVDRSGSRSALFVYLPFAQAAASRGSLVFRAPGPPPLAVAREAARELVPGLAVLGANTLADRAAAALFPQRLAAAVTSACGAFGLVLASVGLYGLVAFFVERKRRELALRAALGADASRLRALALRQGLVPVVVGLILGMGIALALGPVLAAFVPAVGPADLPSLGGAALLLLAVASLAAFLPARRASAASPADALKSE